MIVKLIIMDSENENGKEDVSLESNQPKNLIDPSEFQHSSHNISESPLKKKCIYLMKELTKLSTSPTSQNTPKTSWDQIDVSFFVIQISLQPQGIL